MTSRSGCMDVCGLPQFETSFIECLQTGHEQDNVTKGAFLLTELTSQTRQFAKKTKQS